MKRARTLAAAFDRSFAEPIVVERAKPSFALSIDVGGGAYLLPLNAVTLVSRTPKIVPLPNGPALQLGIAGLRGHLVTVFSLAALLGEPVMRADWLVLVRDVAFAFDSLDGQIELRGAPPNLLDVEALLARVRT
jgi:chemotaxis signal transduction protein